MILALHNNLSGGYIVSIDDRQGQTWYFGSTNLSRFYYVDFVHVFIHHGVHYVTFIYFYIFIYLYVDLSVIARFSVYHPCGDDMSMPGPIMPGYIK